MTYARPTASQEVMPPVKAADYFGCLETPDPEFPGRSRVTWSPRFPFERDVRQWAALHVSRGEVRIWRREFSNGRFLRDIELPMLTITEEQA